MDSLVEGEVSGGKGNPFREGGKEVAWSGDFKKY